MSRKPDPPPDSNKGQGKSGDKQEGDTDRQHYEKQANEATKEGNGGE